MLVLFSGRVVRLREWFGGKVVKLREWIKKYLEIVENYKNLVVGW